MRGGVKVFLWFWMEQGGAGKGISRADATALSETLGNGPSGMQYSICTANPSLINLQEWAQEQKERLYMVHGYEVRKTTKLFEMLWSCVGCFTLKKRQGQMAGFM